MEQCYIFEFLYFPLTIFFKGRTSMIWPNESPTRQSISMLPKGSGVHPLLYCSCSEPQLAFKNNPIKNIWKTSFLYKQLPLSVISCLPSGLEETLRVQSINLSLYPPTAVCSCGKLCKVNPCFDSISIIYFLHSDRREGRTHPSGDCSSFLL